MDRMDTRVTAPVDRQSSRDLQLKLHSFGQNELAASVMEARPSTSMEVG